MQAKMDSNVDDENNNKNDIAEGTKETKKWDPSSDLSRNNNTVHNDNNRKPPPPLPSSAVRYQQVAQEQATVIRSLRRSTRTRSSSSMKQAHAQQVGGKKREVIVLDHDDDVFDDESKTVKVEHSMSKKRRGTRKAAAVAKTNNTSTSTSTTSRTDETTHKITRSITQQGHAADPKGAESKQDSGSGSSRPSLEPYNYPPPNPPTQLDNVKGTWTFDEKARVLLADFRGMQKITRAEKEHLLKMMERDDISVVSWGLVDPIKLDEDSCLDFIAEDMCSETSYHKFRRFDRVTKENEEAYYKEVGFHSMYFE